jgi:putative transcriptional regulator
MAGHNNYPNLGNTNTNEGYMTGKLLVAMPYMTDSRFSQSVIYVCGHDDFGAIGLIINRTFPSLTFRELLRQLSIEVTPFCPNLTMYYGGSIEVSRGFILHSPDFSVESTVVIDDSFAITSTLEILRSISQGEGPKNCVAALGYTGWTAGQLENEIQENTWMIADATHELVFNDSLELKWRHAMAHIGVDPALLSLDSGHA